jgi:exosortase
VSEVIAPPAGGRTREAAGWLALAALASCWLWPVSVSWRTAPDLGHAWAVPVLMAYLWWERWGERPVAIVRTIRWWWLVAAGILAGGQLVLRLLLTPFPLWPMLLAIYTGLFIVTAGLGAWLWAGRRGVAWVLGPTLLMFSALPAPSLFETAIILPLRGGMAALAAEISNALGYPALAAGTSIQLARSWVGVDEACGGIRSLQACVMIGLFFGEWFRFSLWRRALLLAAAMMAALISNFARVLFLALRAQGGPDALHAAHDAAGWLAMLASLTLTGLLACHWAGYRWPPQQRPAAAEPRVSRTWMWVTFVAALFASNELATRLWYAHGEMIRGSAAQWTARLPEQSPSFRSQPLGESAREMLRPDLYVAGSWLLPPDTRVSAYYIEWRRGQVARSVPFLHNPTVCLPLSGCELVETLPVLTVHGAGAEIPFFVYRFRRASDRFLVGFTIWDTARGRPLLRQGELTSWSDWLKIQWGEVRNAQENKPAQLLTVSVPEGSADLSHLKTQIQQLINFR